MGHLFGNKPVGEAAEDLAERQLLLTNSQKWWLAILIGIVAAIFFSEVAYASTNLIFTGLGSTMLCREGGPTGLGFIIHLILFVLAVRFILEFFARD
jgi:hypothetical protein